jgi:rhamnosyltransferase
VVVVDNSTQMLLASEIREICRLLDVYYISLDGNRGIARAQNIGISFARQHGATDILLMDDDSLAPFTLVSQLVTARERSHVYPLVVSARTISVSGNDLSNRSSNCSNGLTICTELTSSGSLIPISVFDRVGDFDDSLFIDCVDFEWGWRAIAGGVTLALCDQVFIQHSLGESVRLGFRIPSPIRHYYQYRNILRMIVRSNAPLGWRLKQSIKLPIKMLLIALLADRRITRLRYVTLGIIDSIKGRSGKFNH